MSFGVFFSEPHRQDEEDIQSSRINESARTIGLVLRKLRLRCRQWLAAAKGHILIALTMAAFLLCLWSILQLRTSSSGKRLGNQKTVAEVTKENIDEDVGIDPKDLFRPAPMRRMRWYHPPISDFNETLTNDLIFTYLSDEKAHPYVGNTAYTNRYEFGSRKFMNAFAVFGNSTLRNDGVTRMHGLLGLTDTGDDIWKPWPMPPSAKKVWKVDAHYAIYFLIRLA